MAKIKHTRNENGQNFTHQNKTTVFWRKKAKINLHQNFPIYGRARQEAVREYTPVLSGSVCRYEPSPVPVVQEVPTCVVEEPEDWMREYPDTPSQPFQLREFRTGQLVGVMASSIRDLQVQAQQFFSIRDPVIATDGAALIGSDGYLMSLRRDAVVVAVTRDVWGRLC